jgi:hypothetical protein
MEENRFFRFVLRFKGLILIVAGDWFANDLNRLLELLSNLKIKPSI